MGKDNKLSAVAKLHVEKMVAMGFEAELIAQDIKDKFDIEVTRQNIWQSYINNRKVQKRVERYRMAMAKELMKHPLYTKTNRLNYILRALNACLTWYDSKIVTDKHGNITEHIQKMKAPAVAPLIREATQIIDGLDDASHQEKMSLLDIIKEFTRTNGQRRSGNDGRAKKKRAKSMDSGKQKAPHRVGSPGARGYEIL